MPRIRTIKPEFWTDYTLARELTRDQRLFYIGLWNEADDEGRFLAHPRRLLGAIFPYEDDLTESSVSDSLRALAATGRVVLYDVKGEPYGQLTKFADHQRINRPSPSAIEPPDSDLATIHDTLTEPSLNDHGGLTVGKERKGKERKVSSSNEDSSKSAEPIIEMWEVWLTELGGEKPHPRMTTKRKQKLRDLYREQLKPHDDPLALFRKVLQAVQRSEHHMGTRAYQMPESLFLNEERRDRWVQTALDSGGDAEAPLTDIEYQRYRSIRKELEDGGMDADSAAEEAMSQVRKAS